MQFELTQEQREIIDSGFQKILVEANAGAAKTTTAALRIWKQVDRGVNPSRIFALAFSEPGVEAYRNAFQRIGMPDSIASKVRLGTVDELCRTRLKKISGVDVAMYRQTREVKPFVLEAIRIAQEKSVDRFPAEFSIQGTGELSVEYLLDDFSYIKGTLGIQRSGDNFRDDPETAADLGCSYTSLAVFRSYENLRTNFVHEEGDCPRFRYIGDATYDMAQHLLSDAPPWNWDQHPLDLGLESIFFDEMHDCNWSMFTVIRHLLELNPNATFMGVGDRDQVIHGKHGADSYFLGPNLNKEIGDVSRLPLTLTHRFGKQVAGSLALHAGKEYKSSTDGNTEVRLHIANNAKDNVGLIFEFANRYKISTGSANEDFAVLLRHPGSSVELEHNLILKGLGYRTVGFKTFLQRPEIAFVRMLLSIAIDHQSQFMDASLIEAKRAVWQFTGSNRLLQHTQEETQHVIDSALEPHFKSFVFTDLLGQAERAVMSSIHAALNHAGSNNPQDVAKFVKALNFSSMAQKVLISQRDIEEAIHSIESFGEVARHYETVAGMLDAMNNIDLQQRRPSPTRHQITLSTIEDAKGLEFRHVFIPDCNARTFDGISQDERNLFYVAASRAQDSLNISHKWNEKSTYLKHFK